MLNNACPRKLVGVGEAVFFLAMQGKRPGRVDDIEGQDSKGRDIKLIDFGFAEKWTPGKPLLKDVGSPFYVAPEVVTEDKQLMMKTGPPLDIWALGVILYVLVTGEPPFVGDEKYDQDMEEKDKEITALKTIYDEEKKELTRLEDYFNKLMLEREAQLAEERKKAEELARVQAQQATLNKAATMLQKMWRGRVARRELEKKKKGGKGGKGGKGKKKK